MHPPIPDYVKPIEQVPGSPGIQHDPQTFKEVAGLVLVIAGVSALLYGIGTHWGSEWAFMAGGLIAAAGGLLLLRDTEE